MAPTWAVPGLFKIYFVSLGNLGQIGNRPLTETNETELFAMLMWIHVRNCIKGSCMSSKAHEFNSW